MLTDVTMEMCAICDFICCSSADLAEHVFNEHERNTDTVEAPETSCSYLVRNMGATSRIDSIIGCHKNPLLQSTANYNFFACNDFCDGDFESNIAE